MSGGRKGPDDENSALAISLPQTKTRLNLV